MSIATTSCGPIIVCNNVCSCLLVLDITEACTFGAFVEWSCTSCAKCVYAHETVSHKMHDIMMQANYTLFHSNYSTIKVAEGTGHLNKHMLRT